MLRLISNIIITQMPTTDYPNRKTVYTFNFVNDVEIKSSWKNLTTIAKIIVPKNIFVKTETGSIVNWVEQDMYANADPLKPPILLRGDRISINLGYNYNAGNGYIDQLNEEFNGFIVKINPKMPLEIEAEDNMWLLKQGQCPNAVFKRSTNTVIVDGKTFTSFNKKNWNSQNIIKFLLGNIVLPKDKTASSYKYLTETIQPALNNINVINGEKLSENIDTNLGDFRTQNETICQVLQRFRKDYKFECFFRKDITETMDSWNDLYVSGIVYYTKDWLKLDNTFITTQYDFNQNIIDTNNLIYLRKEDVRLGIKAYSVGKYELTTTNSSGKKKTKSVRLEKTVGDADGDIRTQFFWPATDKSPDLDLANLEALANQRLKRLKYDGWRGSFQSFGLPYVQHGQAITLRDTIIPERTGTYLIKSTTVKFGINGFRREIEPHIRIDINSGLTIADMVNGL